MNVSQRQLLAFINVARLGSFTKAAQVLHITQSGLSAMTRDLETQLNCRLFDRTTRSVVPTAAGLQLLPVAERVLAELSSVSDSINQIATKTNQILTVGATPLIAASVMPIASQIFARRHPKVTLCIKDLSREKIQEDVGNGTLDMGFGVFFKPASGIERTALADCPLALVSRRGSKTDDGDHLRQTARVHWSALRDKPLISLPPDNPVQELIEEQLKLIGIAYQQRPVYEHFQTILAMVEAGFGVAVLPSFISTASYRYRLKMAILTDPFVPLNFYQITKKGRVVHECSYTLSNAVKEILEAQQTAKPSRSARRPAHGI